MAKNLWSKIKNTANDLTTLEINTIIKSDMVCLKMPENDLLALYRISKTYHSKLVELGNKYWDEIAGKQLNDELLIRNDDQNFFRGEEKFKLAGFDSFRELRERAKESITKILKIQEKMDNISLSEDEIRLDSMILTRIEMQSYEICNILRKSSDELKKKERSITDNKGTEEERKKSLEEYFDIKFELDFRNRQVIQKALDLGVEKVVMQTRIGMDGDITTRISEKFAKEPKQFILQIHNESIDMSVNFWQTLFDALVKFGNTILGNLGKNKESR